MTKVAEHLIRRGAVAGVLIAALTGCDDRGVEADADVPRDAGADTVTPPSPAVLTPCPSGWFEVEGEPARCFPFDGLTIPECPEGETPFVGEGCQRIGTTCTADPFATGLPTEGVIFVDPSWLTTGDGSRSSPYRSARMAMRAAEPGTVVALARGTYESDLFVPPGVTVWGACPAETVVVGAGDAGDGVSLGLFFDGAAARNLSIRATTGLAIAVGEGQSVRLQDVLVADSPYGLAALTNASVEVERVAFEDVSTSAISLESGTTFRGGPISQLNLGGPAWTILGDDVVVNVHDLLLQGSSDRALGIRMEGSSTFALERSLLDAVAGKVLDIRDGASAALRDVVVMNPIRFRSNLAVGLTAADATIEGERVWVRGSPHHNIAVEIGGRIVLRDSIVSDALTDTPTDALPPAAIALLGFETPRPELSLERVLLSNNQGDALTVLNSVAHLMDVTIENGQADPDNHRGRALSVYDDSHVEGSRVLIRSHREVSVFANGSASVTLEDVRIQDTLPRACWETTCASYPAGDALVAVADAEVALTRFVLSHASRACAYVGAGSGLDLEDGRVEECEVGVAIEDEAFDTGRISSGVTFNGVARNIARQSLPVPERVVPTP